MVFGKEEKNPKLFVCWFVKYNLWEIMDLAWVYALGPTDLDNMQYNTDADLAGYRTP